MCRRFTILSLLTALIVAISLESAPAPPQMYPEVYALVYVGKVSYEGGNNVRTAWVGMVITRGMDKICNDPEVQKLAVVKKHGELEKWMRSKIRVQRLENTFVIRIWFAEGTPEEQAVIVNAIMRMCQTKIDEVRQRETAALKQSKLQIKNDKKKGTVNARDEKTIKRREEELRALPIILEWAAVPGKR
jgi:capsular polysaccharide biosynthesis protein